MRFSPLVRIVCLLSPSPRRFCCSSLVRAPHRCLRVSTSCRNNEKQQMTWKWQKNGNLPFHAEMHGQMVDCCVSIFELCAVKLCDALRHIRVLGVEHALDFLLFFFVGQLHLILWFFDNLGLEYALRSQIWADAIKISCETQAKQTAAKLTGAACSWSSSEPDSSPLFAAPPPLASPIACEFSNVKFGFSALSNPCRKITNEPWRASCHEPVG